MQRDAGGEARAQLARMREIHAGYSPLAHARRLGVRGHLEGYAALLAAAGWREPDRGDAPG